MNEKLKRIAELCYEKHELLGTYEFNKEKFAELIIQECVKRIEGCGLDPAQYEFDREFVQGYNKAISKSASQVRLHFGVKE